MAEDESTLENIPEVADTKTDTGNAEGETQDQQEGTQQTGDFKLQEVVEVHSSNLFLDTMADDEEGEGEIKESEGTPGIDEGEDAELDIEPTDIVEGGTDEAELEEGVVREVKSEEKVKELEEDKGEGGTTDELIGGEEAAGGQIEGEGGDEGEGEGEGGEETEGEGEGEDEDAEEEVEEETTEAKLERDKLEMQYTESHRYDIEQRRISGDFAMKRASDMFVRKDFYGPLLEEEEGEGESEKTLSEDIEIEEPQIIDRTPYIRLYIELMEDFPILKIKNNFLQKKMADYFKRRKMEHVLRESERIGDAQEKYFSKLDRLWELRQINNMQRDAISSELNEMRALRNKQVKTVKENFVSMQNRERDIGTGLIFTKTAKEIPDKFLERLLKNQRLKSKEIEEMRYKYIKIRNNIMEITEAIKAMDKIGEHYTLIDYEQLKMENQSHIDKIEERDEELFKLRIKCSAATQCLAHLREKSSYIDIVILEMCDMNDDVELEKTEDLDLKEFNERIRDQAREHVNMFKKERDNLRANIVKLQNESGLLTKTKLLIDMENTLQELDIANAAIQQYQSLNVKNAIALRALKKNIEDEEQNYHPPKVTNLSKKQKKSTKICKGHVKFHFPSLEKFHIRTFEQ